MPTTPEIHRTDFQVILNYHCSSPTGAIHYEMSKLQQKEMNIVLVRIRNCIDSNVLKSVEKLL